MMSEADKRFVESFEQEHGSIVVLEDEPSASECYVEYEDMIKICCNYWHHRHYQKLIQFLIYRGIKNGLLSIGGQGNVD